MKSEFSKYLASDSTSVTQKLKEYGVAIVSGVLNSEECTSMNDGVWKSLEYMTSQWNVQISKSDSTTWRQYSGLFPKHSMLLQNWSIGHAQYVWDVRQNPKVVNIFGDIWNCQPKDLLVSFDGISFHIPPEITNKGWFRDNLWFHTDQSYQEKRQKCVQGWVTGYDVNEGDATLCVLESSHLIHEECQKKFNITEKSDWYKLNQEELDFYIKERGCKPTKIACPKGSLVLWDSRTIHCGIEPQRGRINPNFRNVVYVCYLPRSLCPERGLAKRKKAFEDMRMTSHWPNKVKLFPKTPRTYGAKIEKVVNLPPPRLTELGKQLV
jgi:ectoine hydroxylase-related dioxygenase (phytanoyl-CoA dioxygenase family)